MNSLQPLADKVLLVILDGVGMSENTRKNAVRDAATPALDHLLAHYPSTTLTGSGTAVGLPQGVKGNSEVGHINLGSGRAVRQDLVRINQAIAQQTLATQEPLQTLIRQARPRGRLHFMGLLSDGGVHSHIDHLKELMRIFAAAGDLTLYLHAFMDGRDTGRAEGQRYVEDVLQWDRCQWASMQGRSIAMDRDRRWEKTALAYRTMTGQGAMTAQEPLAYLKSQYRQGIYDEFIAPVLFAREGAIREGDAVFFINFRPDRAQQLARAFCDPAFDQFVLGVRPGHFLCMTPYVDEEVKLPILFDREKVQQTLSEHLSSLGHRQFKIAETEKYAHVTYFFNGGQVKPFAGEKQVLVPSPQDVATYDQRPAMSAQEVTKRLLCALQEDYQFLCVNYANGDMVGHTGNYLAAVKAMEVVDQCVGKLVEQCQQSNVALILTADHGNCDQMVHEDGSPHTAHSSAPVPLVVCHPRLRGLSLSPASGSLALKDVAPTVLACLGISAPEAFTGQVIFPEMVEGR